MKTRKELLLALLLCIFVIPVVVHCQEKRISKFPAHRDKSSKGKYDPDYTLDGKTDGLASISKNHAQFVEDAPGYRSNRAIDSASSANNRTRKNGHSSVHTTNLPKSNTKSRDDVREKGRRFNITIADGICPSIDVRNYAHNLTILQHCEVIEGFLQVVLMENNTEAAFQNYTFPKLREITGYLLVYRVNGLKSLGHLFPNLEVIRGDNLLTDYAFMIYETQNLQEIGLKKLSRISRGGVRIEKNPSLCYTTTLNWDAIVVAGENFVKDNGDVASCPGCAADCGGHCWTLNHCQMTQKRECHEQCLGECTGPSEKECYVCKHYRHEGKCVETCPKHLYSYLSRRCVTDDECVLMNTLQKPMKMDEEQRWRPFNGKCLIQCPDGYEDHIDVNNTRTCRLCEGRCRKITQGAIIRHISDAQRFRGITVVKGALEFQIRNGNPNIMNELTDAFGLIEEITEYLKVTHSFPITSLGFFKKLKVIKGQKLDINNASVVVLDNPNLSSLFPKSQQIEIQNGRLFFHYNPKLCLSEINYLGKMVGIYSFSDIEVQPQSNGEKVACDIVNINITVRDKGPDYANFIWTKYEPSEGQLLLSYLLNYIETENENITYEANSCGNNTWQIVDIDIPSWDSPVRTVSKNITDLKPYTKYAVYVKTFTARNGNYSSPVGQSEIIFFRTKPDIPTPPTNLKSVALSDSEIAVTWDPPERPNGPISYYMLAGFIRPDDEDYLASRDYCEHDLETEPKDLESQEPTVKTPVLMESLSCCSKDSLAKAMVSRKFEIFCPDRITISPFPGKRNYCGYYKYNGMIDDGAANSTTPVDYYHDTLDDSRTRIRNNTYYSFVFNVSSDSRSYNLKKLRHFSSYTISVAACGYKLENGTQMCSSIEYTNTRTKGKTSADDVYNIKTQVLNNTIVVVSWDPVGDPNGLTVAYTIEYTNLAVKDAKKSTECVSQKLYREKRGSHYIRNLSPGKYSLRVRSKSLAGDGNFSKTVYFSLGLNESNTTALTIIVVVFVFLVVSAVVYFFARNHQKRKKQERLIASVNPDYIETKYVVDDWEVPRENVEILEELGLGNFGMVYRGLLEGSVQVAIKTISENASDREKNEFLNEASVMKNFSTFHIIKLLGVVSIGSPPFVIMELMENGDLKTYLRRIRDTHLVPNASRIIRMAAEIADGMAYLESKKFVHRDLAARNCMVSKDLVCKIGDFGMARDIYETDYYKIGKKGFLPIRWMAPENLSDGVFTSDSDVWSYGVVLYEILTLAEIPYQGFANEEVLNYVLRKGTLHIPRNCPEMILKIIDKCFKWRPSERPTFMEIVAELEPFLGQDFCESSFYHSEEGVEIRSLGIKKVYHHAAPIRFHWGNETARWVKEFEDNVTLLDQTKAGTSRGRIFKNGFQHFGNVTTDMEEIPLDR